MYIFVIKQIRIKKKISLYRLSKATGISIGYLQELENNKKNNPTLVVLDKIANVLNVPIKRLFCEYVEVSELKEELYRRIDKYGINSKEAIEVSQVIDLLLNIDMKNR